MEFLQDGEKLLVDRMLTSLSARQIHNDRRGKYYTGKFLPPYVTAGLPEYARNLKLVVGWPKIVVDILEERLDVLGWTDPALEGVFFENAVPVEASKVHIESFVYGMAFVSVTGGGPGEPEVMIRGHSPVTTTGVFNHRTRRLDAAITRQVGDDGEVSAADLWLPDEIVSIARVSGGPWEVVARQDHNLGRVPMVPFANQAGLTDPMGRSEITPDIIAATDSASRAMVSMDVNRTFFSAPRMYGVNVEQDMFVGADGQPVNPWRLVSGRMMMAPPPENEGDPEVKFGQFDPMSPGPYLEQIRGLSSVVAAEAGIPPSYLGFVTDNPTSADAQRQHEARLIKRAERRQSQFDNPWSDVGQLVQIALGGEPDPSVRMRWADASTPTVAATTDAMLKQTQMQMLPPGSEVALDKLGYSQDEKRTIQREWAQQRTMQRSALLGQSGVSQEAIDAARANRPPVE